VAINIEQSLYITLHHYNSIFSFQKKSAFRHGRSADFLFVWQSFNKPLAVGFGCMAILPL